MKRELPVYEIYIDLNEEDTTVSFNSLVLEPAHEISYETFSQAKKLHFSDEERVITGVAISADTPIYRYDENTQEEYYVVFTKDAIKNIIVDYARRNNFNNLNLDHNGAKVVDKAYMIHSYQIDEEKGFTKPERFHNVNDGSWITSYKIMDEDIWNRAKAGEWTGYSVEGTFFLKETDKTIEEEMMAQVFKALSELREAVNGTNKHNK
jgi:hypothetical protein